MVLERCDLPCLESLELSRYGIGKGTDPSAPWPEDIRATQRDLEQLLPSNRYHTSSVTSMVLSDPSTPPIVSEHILRWPRRLERLSITFLTHSSYASQYTLTNVERLLGIHRHSLKYIKIGIIPGAHEGMPDFSSFQCLEELHLSTYELLAEAPSNALRKLAGPYLRHLSMTFSPEDQHSESNNEFAIEQVRWMSDFATLKRSDHPTSRLEKIHIDFIPDHNPLYLSDFEDVTWPWDYLDEAGQKLAQHGLALTYSKPRWPKEEWEELVEAGKAAKAGCNAECRNRTGDPGSSAEI